MRNAIICSTASLGFSVGSQVVDIIGDPTEGALLLLGKKLGLSYEVIRNTWVSKKEEPFNPITKRMVVMGQYDKKRYVYAKGAPESILSISTKMMYKGEIVPLTKERIDTISSEFLQFAGKGLRMIAYSYKTNIGGDIESDHIFLGFVGISDPVRPEVAEAVTKAKQAGIKVVMITGDNELTAEAVAIEAGLLDKKGEIIRGDQLDTITDAALSEILPNVRVFARITPDQKYRLVKLYQKNKEIVAVTGDGVNDALALKQADVGIAMGITGTDVAKETSDMVVTDDNFATIVTAIEEGRHIIHQIKNTVKYLLSCNLGEIIYIVSAVALNQPVLSALQILYMNIITDGMPALALAFAPHDAQVMRRKPNRTLTVLEKHDMRYLYAIGIATAILGYVSSELVSVFLAVTFQERIAMVFTTIVFVQLFVFIDIWVSHKSIGENMRLFSSKMFFLAFVPTIVIHPFILYLPLLQQTFSTVSLSPVKFAYAVLSAGLLLIGLECVKAVRRKLKR